MDKLKNLTKFFGGKFELLIQGKHFRIQFSEKRVVLFFAAISGSFICLRIGGIFCASQNSNVFL